MLGRSGHAALTSCSRSWSDSGSMGRQSNCCMLERMSAQRLCSVARSGATMTSSRSRAISGRSPRWPCSHFANALASSLPCSNTS